VEQIKLSPSKLNMFNDCPRCFYDTYTLKIVKPRGIFPSLPGGMDLVIKKHFDNFRGSMPPEIKDRVEGALMKDQALLKRWRFWRTGMTYNDEVNNILLIGAIDDCVVYADLSTVPPTEYYIPLDYKTKGSEPKDDGSQYYQTQLDCYNLMLLSTGYKIKEIGYLVYFYPTNVHTLEIHKLKDVEKVSHYHETITRFGISVFKIPCSSERAKELIRKAAECLRGKRPKASMTCEHCEHIEKKIVWYSNEGEGSTEQ